MKTLVTGASGHIGSTVVGQLLDDGVEVRAMVRASSRRRGLPTHDGLEVVEGDLRDFDSLRHAVAGCRRIFHVASPFSLWTRHPGELIATNRIGTRNLFDAVQAAPTPVDRIVMTSSALTMGFTTDPEHPFDEHNQNDGAGQDEYNEAKIEAERLAGELGQARGQPVVFVNPTLVLGPGDWRPTPSNRVIVDYLDGKIPGWYEGGFSPVHVADVARGHILAMESGTPGERYVLGGHNIRFVELLDRLQEITGLPRPRLRIPRPLAMAVAAGYELTSHFTGRQPLVTRGTIRHLYGTYDFYDSGKARRELGYEVRPLDQVLRDAVQWFVDHTDLVRSSRRDLVRRRLAA